MAATSCAVQNLSLMGTALGVAGMSAFSIGRPMPVAMHMSLSVHGPQTPADGGPCMSTRCM